MSGSIRFTRSQIAFCAVLLGALIPTARAQFEFEREPIEYSKAPTSNPISELQDRLDAGETSLEYDADKGYLPALLRRLEIHESSQVLVQSKTSLQLRLISPRRPRALYFNDHTHIGWVRSGETLEIMTTDPTLGEVFYTLKQQQTARPKFERDAGQCLSCHASSKTHNAPGGLVRSVFLDPAGQPHYNASTFTIDHASDFKNRWGGYYVTGTHGDMRHMGNVVSSNDLEPTAIDREAGANVTDLSDRVDTSPYLTGHSDIVALMVLEHQTQMQNLITRAGYEARSALHHDGLMNRILERPDDYVSETTQRRIASAGDKLLRYLLFADEFTLKAPVAGTTKFARQFQSLGPRDSKGRSLRDFDLKTRMFTHPCSYLIYSKSFDQLPEPMLRHVVTRLREALQPESDAFPHLSAADRRAIFEILAETKPKLWKLAR